MKRLFAATFSDTSSFDEDLARKDWVLLLRDTAGSLTGFTTLQKTYHELEGQRVAVFFSGDTVVASGQRHRSDLARLWSSEVFSQVAVETCPCYWFLICSGFRTYRFLPVFYSEFFPRFDRPTPLPLRHFLDQLATQRFGPLYDPQSGVVKLAVPCLEPLPERQLDEHAQFFLKHNPGWARGHELACLTRLETSNLTAAGRRMVVQKVG